MTKLMIVITAGASLLFALGRPAFADEVPKFDVKRNCHVDVTSYQGDASSKACIADEQQARNTLIAGWKRFPIPSRIRCSRMVGDIAGSQSYVELLTCLQMAQDVKKLPN